MFTMETYANACAGEGLGLTEKQQIKFDMSIDLSGLYSEERYGEEFPHTLTTYESYLSRNREANLKCELTKMRFRLTDGGFSNGEIARALLETAQDICKRMP